MIALLPLITIALALCYISYKLWQIRRDIKEIYELPHGESLYSIKHHEFNAISLQYVLIAVRSIMHTWMRQSVATENFEAANDWKIAIEEVEKLISTKINE